VAEPRAHDIASPPFGVSRNGEDAFNAVSRSAWILEARLIFPFARALEQQRPLMKLGLVLAP
jgi:hypothetical protein